MCQGPRALTQRSPSSGRPRGRAASTPQDALAGGPSPAQHLAAFGRLVAASSSQTGCSTPSSPEGSHGTRADAASPPSTVPAWGRRPAAPGPALATGVAPTLRGAAPARTFTDASPTRTPQPHLAAVAPTRPGAAVHPLASRGPTTRTACGRSFTYSVTLTPHSPPATPVRQHPPRAGPFAADCSSPALSGTLLALARCDPEPHRLPGRVGGSSRTSAGSHRLRLAADSSSPASSGPLLALARCDPEPHRLPGRVGGSSRTSAGSHRLRLAADCSSPASSGPLLALARCDPEPHRLPGRVGGSSRTSAFGHQLDAPPLWRGGGSRRLAVSAAPSRATSAPKRQLTAPLQPAPRRS